MASIPQNPATSNHSKKSPKLVEMPATMQAALLNMNERYCLVEHLPAIVSIPTLKDPNIHVYSRGEFVNTLCGNKHIDGINVGRKWIEWPSQRRARNITYAPGSPLIVNGDLNTWVQSPVKPKKGELSYWNSYLDHIFKSDSTYRDWFTAWLAYQFQHPGTKLHSAVVFWSSQTGTGKSLFGYIMRQLFGEHNFSEIGEGDLHGSFNFWAARKQFVMGEEIRGTNAQKHADYLKAVITRKTVTINTKNTPHYTIPDCINYFFTSNHSEAFYLDKNDRRFFVHELGPDKLKAEYVRNEFFPWLEAGGYAAILYHLINEVDLTKPVHEDLPFNPHGAAPQTRARAQMVEASKDEADVWLDYLASSPGDTFYNTPGWKLATAEDLWSQFTQKCPRSKITYRSFCTRVRAICPMVRGGNTFQVAEGEAPKRIFCPPQGLRGYDGATAETLITSYWEGKE